MVLLKKIDISNLNNLLLKNNWIGVIKSIINKQISLAKSYIQRY